MRPSVPGRPRPRPRLLPHRAAAVAAALAAAAALAVPDAAHAGPAAPPHVVRDADYGEVLFQFFQEDDFTALTELMVAQARGRLPHHADEAEVLRGGLLLSYGMHREAGRIFEQLIARHASPATQDRAWYFLARIRHQRGLDAEAAQALARIGGTLPAPLEESRRLLQAQLLMARGDNAEAGRVLDALVASTSGGLFSHAQPSLYARYNLGVAEIRAGDTARGVATLEAIGTMPAPDEETRALRDRANVALGFVALKDGRPADARLVLSRVRLDGGSADQALLGFGWAAAAMKQYDQALVPWTELAGRPAQDAAALEARIAAPWAFRQLGARGQALQHYQAALAAYTQEDARLGESIDALRSGVLVRALARLNPQQGMGWNQGIARLPAALPHPAQLADVLAQDDFQEGFKRYRDLRFLAANLSGWQDKLDAFDDMLDNRRRAYAERLPQVRAQAARLDVDALQRRHDALATELDRARQDDDGRDLADAAERALQARVADAEAALARATAATPDEPALARDRERLRLARGALAWRLSQEAPARLWDATKSLHADAAALERARALQADLARAQREEPARFDGLAARIAALRVRLAALQPRVAALADAQRDALQDLAVAALQRQRDRLAGYRDQARFAVAQLYDDALRADDAPQPASAPAAAPAPGGAAASAPAGAAEPAPQEDTHAAH